MQGRAKSARLQQLDSLKNRYTYPLHIDPSVTLDAILATGDDTRRWNSKQAAEIEGFVYDVKVGGVETTNCGAPSLAYRDAHIEIVKSLGDSGPTRRMIVEVTPRMRAIAEASGLDRSTQSLMRLKGHLVKIRGWMLFDLQHSNEAENTVSGRAGNCNLPGPNESPMGFQYLAGNPITCVPIFQSQYTLPTQYWSGCPLPTI